MKACKLNVFFSQRNARLRSGLCPWHMFGWYTLNIYIYCLKTRIAQVVLDLMQIKYVNISISFYIYLLLISIFGKIIWMIRFQCLFFTTLFGSFFLRPSPSLAELRPILEPVWDLKTQGWWLLMAGNSLPILIGPTHVSMWRWVHVFGFCFREDFINWKKWYTCFSPGLLAQSTGGLSLAVHNFWLVLHRNPVFILEKITQAHLRYALFP